MKRTLKFACYLVGALGVLVGFMWFIGCSGRNSDGMEKTLFNDVLKQMIQENGIRGVEITEDRSLGIRSYTFEAHGDRVIIRAKGELDTINSLEVSIGTNTQALAASLAEQVRQLRPDLPISIRYRADNN